MPVIAPPETVARAWAGVEPSIPPSALMLRIGADMNPLPPMRVRMSAAVRPVSEVSARMDWFIAPEESPSWSTPLVAATPRLSVVAVFRRLSAPAVKPPARTSRPLVTAVEPR